MGLTHNFGQKYEFFYTSFYSLKHIEIMFRYVLERNRSFLNSKSLHGVESLI